MIYLQLAVLIYNVVAFGAYGLDKYKAIHHQHRISEKSLLILAFCCGGWGALLGMYIFRHKTKHLRFRILVPLFAIMQTLILGELFQRF